MQIPSSEQAPDLFTNPLSGGLFDSFRDLLGISTPEA